MGKKCSIKWENLNRSLKKHKIVFWLVGIGVAYNIGYFLALSTSDNPTQVEKNYPQTQIIEEQESYSVAYDIGTKNPAWVLEVLRRGDELKKPPASSFEYTEPLIMPEQIRSTLEAYNHAGYKVGPLLASAAFISPYPLLAASPQNSDLADNFWIHFNDYVLQILSKLDVDRVLIITGPLYLPKNESTVVYDVVGQQKIAVPTHFYRAIFYPKMSHEEALYAKRVGLPGVPSIGAPIPTRPLPRMNLKGEIYLIPNVAIDTEVPLNSFKISLEEWEKISGITLTLDNIRFYLGET